MFSKRKHSHQLDRTKNDEKIIEYVLAGDAAKLRPLVEKKKFSSLLSADRMGRIPIVEACRLGFTECAEILLAAEPEANVLDDDFRSPLHLAAMQGHTDCATLLCKKGMNVDAQDRRGQTALHLAAVAGNADVLQALIAFSADTEMADKDGNTPLLCATKSNQRQTAIALMNASSNVNAANRQQKTSLMHACEHGAADVVQMLLQRGAAAHIKDTGGRTALSYAKMSNHKACEDLLPADAPLGRMSTSEPSGGTGGGSGMTGDTEGNTSSTGMRRMSTGGAGFTQMRDQIQSLTAQLAKANEEKQAAKSEADALREQLAAYEGDDMDVTFNEDDTIDLGHDPSSPQKLSPEQEIKMLKQKIGHLAAEKKMLEKKLAAAEEQAAEAVNSASGASSEELKKEIADLKEQISEMSGGMPMVPIVVLDQLRKDHESQIAKLRAEGGGGAPPATNGTAGASDDKRVAFYRQQLLLAINNELSDDVRAALEALADQDE